MEVRLKYLIGGPAHGEVAPGYWQDIGEWLRPGQQDRVFYHERCYAYGADRYTVWVHMPLPDDDAAGLVYWHHVVMQGSLLAAQKELLSQTNEHAKVYTGVIMAGGYAGLFTLIAQLKDQLTSATLFAAAGLLAISVMLFVGWEVAGMIVRGLISFGTAKAVSDPAGFAQSIEDHRERTAALMRKMQIPWYIVSGTAIAAATACFIILISAMIDGFLSSA